MTDYLILISTGGDLHTGGLATKPTKIKIDHKHKRSVDAYLKYQTIFRCSAYNKSFPNDKTSTKAFKNLGKSFRKLKQLKIFDSKYHYRTQWEYMDE